MLSDTYICFDFMHFTMGDAPSKERCKHWVLTPVLGFQAQGLFPGRTDPCYCTPHSPPPPNHHHHHQMVDNTHKQYSPIP